MKTELVSRSIQDGEEYLNFDLEAEQTYPARIRVGENHLEVIVGESFEYWENDNISRKKLTSEYENSFYIEEDMELHEARERHGELFEKYSDQVTEFMENQNNSEPLNQVRAALD
jgi:thymidylate synthase